MIPLFAYLVLFLVGGLALVTSKKISIALLLATVACALEIGLGALLGVTIINPFTIVLCAGLFGGVVGIELNAKKGVFDM